MHKLKKIVAALTFGIFMIEQSLLLPMGTASALKFEPPSVVESVYNENKGEKDNNVGDSVYSGNTAVVDTPVPISDTDFTHKGMDVRRDKGLLDRIGAELPDINISKIELNPENPKEGEEVKIGFEITNSGSIPLKDNSDLDIKFTYDKNVYLWEYNLDKELKPGKSIKVKPGKDFEGSVQVAEKGIHFAKIEADYPDAYVETDEENNKKVTCFQVSGTNSENGLVQQFASIDDVKEENLALKATKKFDYAKLAWTKLKDAKEYTVLRSDVSKSGYVEVAKGITQNRYIDKAVEPGKTYYYIVKSYEKSSNEAMITIAEKLKRFDPKGDNDKDGITNEEELLNGTDMDDSDTDGDGKNDFAEIKVDKTSPLRNPKLKAKKESTFGFASSGKKVKRSFSSTDKRVEVEVSGDDALNNVQLTAKDIDQGFYNMLPGIVGKPVELSAEGQQFDSATISMSYKEEELKGTAEKNLKIFWVNEKNGQLEPIKDIKVDWFNNKVTGTTTHFSTYLLGSADMVQRLGDLEIQFMIDRSAKINQSEQAADSRIDLAKKIIAKISAMNKTIHDGNATAPLIRASICDFSHYVRNRSDMQAVPYSDPLVNSMQATLDTIKASPFSTTNIAEALAISGKRFEMYNQTLNNAGGKKRKVVILLTDGLDTVGNSNDALIKIAGNINPDTGTPKENVLNHITVHTVSIGANANSSLLKDIAEKTGGAYLFYAQNANMTGHEINSQINSLCDKLVKSICYTAASLTVGEEIDILDEERMLKGIKVEYPGMYKGLAYDDIKRLYDDVTGANMITGNYITQAEDMNIHSSGVDVNFERTYNSLSANEKTVIGNGWRLNYDTEIKKTQGTQNGIVNVATTLVMRNDTNAGTVTNIMKKLARGIYVEYVLAGGNKITVNSGGINWVKIKYGQDEGWVPDENIKSVNGIEVEYPSGSHVIFDEKVINGVVTYYPPVGIHDTFRKISDTIYELELKDGTTYVYNGFAAGLNSGKLIKVRNKYNNELTLERKTDGTIDRIRDAFKKSIVFEYGTDAQGSKRIERIYTEVLTNVELDTYFETFDIIYGYDAAGNLISVKDAAGKITKYEYYTGGLLKKITDPRGIDVVKNDYDPFGRLVRQYNGNGYVRYQIYKDAYKLANGSSVSDDENTVRYSIDEDGFETITRFNAQFKPIEESNCKGETSYYSYEIYNKDDPNSYKYWAIPEKLETVQDKTTYLNLTQDNLKTKETIKDRIGYYTGYWYDENSNMTQTRDYKSRKDTYMTYNSKGMVTEIREGELWKNWSDMADIRQFFYSPSNPRILTKVIDAEGNVTDYTYYSLKEPSTIQGVNCKLIGVNGLVKEEFERKKIGTSFMTIKITQYEYNDGSNFRTRIIENEGKVGTTGSLVCVPVNQVIEKYDRMGRLRETINNEGYSTVYEYDAMNRLIAETDHLGLKTLTDGSLARDTYGIAIPVPSDTASLNHTKVIEYDAAGNVIAITNKNKKKTEYKYDGENQLIQSKDPVGNTIRYSYDGRGNKVSETNARGIPSVYDYDYLGRLVCEESPIGGAQTTYDYSVRSVAGSVYNIEVIRKSEPIYNDPSITKDPDEPSEIITNTEIDYIQGLKTEWTTYKNQAGVEFQSHKTITSTLYNGLVDSVKIDAAGTGKDVETRYTYDKIGRLRSKIDGYVQYSDPVNKIEYTRSNGILQGPKDSDNVKVGNFETRIDYTAFTVPSAMETYIPGIVGNRYLKMTTTTPGGKATIKIYSCLNRLVKEVDAENYKVKNSALGAADILLPGNKGTEYTYTGSGMVRTIKYPRDNTVASYFYDELGRVKEENKPGGGKITKKYDSEGNLTSQITSIGIAADNKTHQTIYTYYPNGLLQKITEKSVNVNIKTGQIADIVSVYYTYDENGNVSSKTDALGNTTTYIYDLKDRLFIERGPIGGSKVYYYDEAGNLIKLEDKNRHTSRYIYDGFNRLIKASDYKGNVVQTKEYDEIGNVIKVKDGNNNVTEYQYDKLSRLRNVIYDGYDSVLRPSESTISRLTTKYFYNDDNLLSKKANSAVAEDESYSYDNVGRVRVTTATKIIATGTTQVKTYENFYDEIGNVVKKTEKCEVNGVLRGKLNTTEYQYDNENRVSKESVSYDKGTVKVTHNTVYGYDLNGNVLTVTKTIDETPDGGSPVNTLTNVLETNKYDDINRLVEKKDGTGTVVEKLVYDGNNNQIWSYDAYGKGTEFKYNRNNQLEKTIDPLGHTITQFYDENSGNQVSWFDGNKYYYYTYDANNRLTQVRNSKYETADYEYDNNGNLIKVRDGKGNETIYEYNSRNLISKRIYPGGRTGTSGSYTYTAGKFVSYLYYPDGSKKQQTERNSTVVSYKYYLDSELMEMSAAKSGATTQTVSYTYDAQGNPLSIKSSQDEETQRVYDELGRVVSKSMIYKDTSGNTRTTTSNYVYDITTGLEAGSVIAERSEYPGGAVTTKAFDAAGRVKFVYDGGIGSSKTTYNYRLNGAKESVLYQDGSREEYYYNDDGLLDHMYGYIRENNADKILNQCAYSYDRSHNMTVKDEIINEKDIGETFYTYDSMNRIENILEPSGKFTKYSYDAAGNRIKEVVQLGNDLTVLDYTYNEFNEISYYETRKPTSFSYVSDMAWVSSSGGSGPVERDMSNGGNASNDGSAISLNGLKYAKGVGTFSKSTIEINLNKRYNKFRADIGIDDASTIEGAVDFKVYADNQLIYDSGSVYKGDETRTIDVSVTDKMLLRLEVTSDDSSYADYADWANAILYKSLRTEKKSYTYNNGNVTKTRTTPYNSDGTAGAYNDVNYDYDLFNQLTKVTSGTTVTESKYGPEGLRVGKKTNGTWSRYFYEEDKVVFETDITGNVTARNIVGSSFIARKVDGQNLHYLYNGQGDIVTIINEGTNNVVGAFYYDAFGNILNNIKYGDVDGNGTIDSTDAALIVNSSGLTTLQKIAADVNGDGQVNNSDQSLISSYISNPVVFPADKNGDGYANDKTSLGYKGYFFDPETGLYYLNARMYDPKTARFMQEDTYTGDQADPLSLNLYTYCHNEPIMYTDPTGHFNIFSGDDWANAGKSAFNTVVSSGKAVVNTIDNGIKKGIKYVKQGVGYVVQGAQYIKEKVNEKVKQVVDLANEKVIKPIERKIESAKQKAKKVISYVKTNPPRNLNDVKSMAIGVGVSAAKDLVLDPFIDVTTAVSKGLESFNYLPQGTGDNFYSNMKRKEEYAEQAIIDKYVTNKPYYYAASTLTDIGCSVYGAVCMINGGRKMIQGGFEIGVGAVGEGETAGLSTSVVFVGAKDLVLGAAESGYGFFAAMSSINNSNINFSKFEESIKDTGKSKYSFENGEFNNAEYHGQVGNSVKSKAPQDGQFALDNSVEIKGTTDRRVGIDSNGDFVVLDKTVEGTFHGHVRPWKSNDPNLKPLTDQMKNALRKAGYVKEVAGKGKLTQKSIDLINGLK